jgi:hypothetical protein
MCTRSHSSWLNVCLLLLERQKISDKSYSVKTKLSEEREYSKYHIFRLIGSFIWRLFDRNHQTNKQTNNQNVYLFCQSKYVYCRMYLDVSRHSFVVTH